MQRLGEAKLPKLFEKIKVGGYELKNRVKYAAC